jgi:ubiquitin-protein ligase
MPFFDDPRTRRLKRDFEEMKKLEKESTILKFKAAGDPPDHYELTFHGRGIVSANPVKFGDTHRVDVSLGADFPRQKPSVHWMTKIVHPNISGSSVCFGNFQMSPYVKLTEIVEILWDMGRLALFNPHGGYQDNIDWYALMKQVGGFPVDKRILRNKAPQAPKVSEAPGEEDMLIMEGGRGRWPQMEINFPGSPLFSSRNIMATPGAANALEESKQSADEFLYRHFNGDWGQVPEEDASTNERAVTTRGTIMSAYTTRIGRKIWIITDPGHEVTTILLPEEY